MAAGRRAQSKGIATGPVAEEIAALSHAGPAEAREQRHLAVREFQRIMMQNIAVHVDLRVSSVLSAFSFLVGHRYHRIHLPR
jgi:hypothetical protein